MESELIITGASSGFESSLLALIGSLNVNWPDHPRVLVYDLGIGQETLSILNKTNIEVRKVPQFCPHWRKYFTWRFWCVEDAPTDNYLWLDAGVCVLRPMPEVFVATKNQGYFCSTNHGQLSLNMSKNQQMALGITQERLRGMVSINAGIFGLSKNGKGIAMIAKGKQIAKNEKNMIPTEPLHRHDQPIWTALLYEFYDPILFADFKTYAGWESPIDVLNQKVWVHRRRMRTEDMKYFHKHIDKGGAPHIPQPLPPRKEHSLFMKLRIQIARFRGRTPKDNKAGTVIYNGVSD